MAALSQARAPRADAGALTERGLWSRELGSGVNIQRWEQPWHLERGHVLERSTEAGAEADTHNVEGNRVHDGLSRGKEKQVAKQPCGGRRFPVGHVFTANCTGKVRNDENGVLTVVASDKVESEAGVETPAAGHASPGRGTSILTWVNATVARTITPTPIRRFLLAGHCSQGVSSINPCNPTPAP